ncbi:ATP-binding protein [Pontibacter toksunensis]|uniref:histidine kinase n=1 Tax=Pontibacter toksunensis TaxID=1332631 RepID=A0ABW6BWG2_9BACT
MALFPYIKSALPRNSRRKPGEAHQLQVPEHISIEVGELPFVLICRALILQVFQNLLYNTIKYVDNPLGRIEVVCDQEAGYIRVSVRDNGVEIKRRNFEKIFYFFNKTHKITGADSSGIGLSIVKKIVETKGGQV